MKAILPIILHILLLKCLDCSVLIPDGGALASRASTICQNIPNGVMVANPVSCSAFYLCTNGVAEPGFCPGELWFNPRDNSCDFPEFVDCDESQWLITDDNIVCPIVDDPNRIVYLASRVDCERYYICYHGQPKMFQCKSGYYWNSALEKCGLPQTVECKINNQNNNNNNNNNNNVDNGQNGIPECPASGTSFFPHPKVCDWFIYCRNGIQSVQQCQFLHHYDVNEGRCKFQSSAKCVINV